MLFLACSDALAPTRRVALRHAAGVAALSLTTAQRAVAATNAEAEKVRVASRELTELLKNEDALRFKVLVEGSGKLPIAVSFITFQAVWQSNFARDSLTHCLIYAQVPEAREGLRRRLHGRGDRIRRDL